MTKNTKTEAEMVAIYGKAPAGFATWQDYAEFMDETDEYGE
jgi:hypothetical protein